MKRLQIGIDINEANVTSRVGTGQYLYNILKYFHNHDEIDFHLYHRDALQGDMPVAAPHWQYIQVSPSRAWLSFSLPLYLAIHKRNDVFWAPAHYMSALTKSNNVVTIHDLAYEYFPKLFLLKDLYKLKKWTRHAISHSRCVISVSSATKDDLVKLYGLDPTKIVVIHNGYDNSVFNTKDPDKSILDKWHLKNENYILFLGTIQPRKNAIKLIQAFTLLKESGYKGKLVLAGGIGWLAQETLEVIRTSPHHKDIVMTGYVSDQERKALYSFAGVYVLPSLYEGFGVPAIEAMGCGAPVVVADNSSLPEVVGDAAVLFNASDSAGMAHAISTVLKDRASWVKKSLARAKRFSWEKCAKETLKILMETGK